MSEIRYEVEPGVADLELNDLFSAAWPDARGGVQFGPLHEHSLVHLCAYDGGRLVGYVNVAWDGGIHAFLLNPTVHPDVQHRGIGTELVRRANDVAKQRGARFMHVDFEPELRSFYDACGFKPTEAGLVELR